MTTRRAKFWCPLFVTTAILCRPAEAHAQQVVIVTLPAAVGFPVNNVGQATPGSPYATTASFIVLNLALFHVLRVSVKADSDFVPPGGAAIPASHVSWTTSNASGVIGTKGTLSVASYSQVFQMQSGLISAGSVDVHWTLAPPGAGIRAGAHTAIVRWRLESIVP